MPHGIPDSAVLEGDTKRLGPYQLLKQLGQGGMASVYIAKGPSGRVAIKILHSVYAQKPDQVSQFQAEGRAALSLRHPHLVRGLDSGEEKGRHYVALELVAGPTLAERMAEDHLTAAEVIPLILQVLGGLEHMHREGMVHCDATPQNILFSSEDAVKLCDFGVVTRVGLKQKSVRGTYSYMSPEQARGRPVDGRSDQYSVAVLLWEVLAGQRLFQRGAAHLTLAATVEDPVPPLTDPAWDAILQRALAKDPEKRFETCASFAESIRAQLAD